MQISVIIVLFALILEFVEFSETYKYIRPYKFYNPHSWRPPRWHPLPKPRKYYHSKKGPSKYHSYESDHHRYAPHYGDSGDTYDDVKPYVIIIQFPPKKDKKKYHSSHERQHIIHSPRDIDYIDDDKDEDELKVYELDEKGVQIKINH